MKFALIGETGISVSHLGLGTVKFGRNQGVHYPKAFELPSDQAILDLLGRTKELGINLLDTAPAYGNSEERLGALLKNQRHDWVLSTKVGEEFVNGESAFDFSPKGIQASVERSLQRLQTDYLDIVLVHSNGEDKKIIEEHTVFQTLSALKAAGKIRAFGMSTKTIEGGLLTVDQADVVMVTYNLLHQEEHPVIAYAHLHNKGVFIKKAFASGHLDKIGGPNPILATMRLIFSTPGVSSVILGTLNPEHLRANVTAYLASH